MLVSVVIPCYYSQATIGRVVELVMAEFEKNEGYDCDFILVNDGSEDGTYEEIRRLASCYSNVRGVNLMRNFGQHNALMAGLAYADGDYILGMDDDMQTHPSQIFKLIHKIEEGFDLVYGVYPVRKNSWLKNFSSKLNEVTSRVMLNRPKEISSSNFWIITNAVKEEVVKYTSYNPYIDGVFYRVTHNIGNVEVEHFKREQGTSNYTFRKLLNLWLAYWNFSVIPLRISFFLGIFAGMAGVLIAILVVINKLLHPNVPVGWSSSLCVSLLFFALILMVLGIVGEYLGKIIQILNNTPQYIVREMTDSGNDECIEKESKKIMILGAGIYQVPLIRAARKMGLYTIVVSIPGEYPGFALADQIYHVDTRNKEEILRIARKEKISGICTAGTDVAVASVGYVCERMGLAGLSEKAAACVTDKALMKSAFVRGHVSTAPYREVHFREEAEKAAEEIGYPVVVKRVDSSGSRGITIVEKPEDLKKAFLNAAQDSQRDYVIVEKFLTGEEIGVDGVVQNGKIVFLAPHKKYLYRCGQTTVPAGHGFPLQISEEAEEEIRHQMQLAVNAVGLDRCSFNADVICDGNQVSLLEIGGRTGATCIPELISLHYGIDFYEKIIQNALGLPLVFPEKRRMPCMAKLLMSPVDGRITEIREKELQHIRESGAEVVIDFQMGHPVQKMQNGTDRIGHVIAETDSETEFQKVLDMVYSCIDINGQSLEELWKK